MKKRRIIVVFCVVLAIFSMLAACANKEDAEIDYLEWKCDWKIDFVGKSNSIDPPAAVRDESIPGAPTYKIVNAEPFLIGLSGLEGTTGMLLTGFIIMAIATNAYLVRRHKQREKQM